MISTAQARLHRFEAFGEGAIIRPPYTILSPDRIAIGANTTIGPHALLSVVTEHLGDRYEPRLSIGERCSIGQNFVVGCIDEVTIGDDVLISSNVFVGDCIHGYFDVDIPVIAQPLQARGAVAIEDGAFLGINSIILPGVRIGRNAVVGAGAVVTSDVAPFTVVVGNPAHEVRRFDGASGGWRRVHGRVASESAA